MRLKWTMQDVVWCWGFVSAGR